MDSTPTPSQDAESERNDSDRPQRLLSQDAEDAADADIAAGRTHPVSGARELIEWLHAPQDAEGDGRIAARRDYDMWLDHNIHAQPTTFETWIAGWDAHESSIRADYEELVKAAREALECGLFDCGKGHDESACDHFFALDRALTRIEESQ